MRKVKTVLILLIVSCLHLLLFSCAVRPSEPFEVLPEEYLPREEDEIASPSALFLTFDESVENWFTVPSIKRLCEHFDRAYPILCNALNGGTYRKIRYRVATLLDAPCVYEGEVDGKSVVAIDPAYFKKNCEDFTLLARALSLAVFRPVDAKKDAPATESGGAWVTEAIAEYGLYLTAKDAYFFEPYREGQSFTESGRVAFSFFVWIGERYERSFTEQMVEALRCEAYHERLFVTITGYTVTELWEIYAASDHGVTK